MAANRSTEFVKLCALFAFIFAITETKNVDDEQEKERAAAEKENKYHAIDTAFLLVMMFLLIITVLTVWLFKVKRFRFLHETGVCMIYGMIIGLLIKYIGGESRVPVSQPNCTIPSTTKKLYIRTVNGSQYSYSLSGPVQQDNSTDQGSELEQKASDAVFDPEIFFYVLLPPIIFYAGYDMKKRFFFRNIGAILTYAFVGTTVSCVVFGSTMYAYTKFATVDKDFNFLECLLFGALISATDPVTVLAIFHDLHVDVDLYALVFGESVMNDAVAIVLFRSVETYLLDKTGSGFQVDRFFESVGVFIGVFSGSFFLGFAMGLVTALVTKLTRISDFPLLETALFFLLSWTTFLMAEAANLTGIVAVLFCGISQAHYTYNNLSEESKINTKQQNSLNTFSLMINFQRPAFPDLNTIFWSHVDIYLLYRGIFYVCVSGLFVTTRISSNRGLLYQGSIPHTTGTFYNFGRAEENGTLYGGELVTKLTRISDFPLLETALFFLLSWTTFLMAEAANLTGIVAVLFCGISQAHYTYNNLSEESKINTKQTFALLNFLAESFIFSYMGLSLFTFENHQWNIGFISWTFFAMTLGRLCNIYPLSFLLNLGRHRKISFKFQHMMVFDDDDSLRSRQAHYERAWIFRKWYDFDNVNQPWQGRAIFLSLTSLTYMKPIFTNYGQSLTETLPGCCGPLARRLSPKPQPKEEPVKADSDDDMINVNGELSFTGGVMVRPTSGSMISNEPSDIMREGDLGLGAVGGAQA
ncbi:unnamed protein product [Porites evermanni]|uniref:Cation/H+ exchanger transmembrane domain-containing protein n=1 Tax=Porites evermanni TaxID=104178 RepID=A0ABN8ML35_9CNID|nr:unnamed protein product [Porites evermanni]